MLRLGYEARVWGVKQQMQQKAVIGAGAVRHEAEWGDSTAL